MAISHTPDGSQEARPAATVILMRENPKGAPHLLMAERAASLVFAGGATVFPGGAVDEADKHVARSLDIPIEEQDLAARIAAVRETLEECGLAIAEAGQAMTQEMIVEARAALHAKHSFAELIEKMGLAFDYEALVPFARWCPPSGREKRRFDTRFYLSVIEAGHLRAVEDGGETTRLVWHTAREALDAADAGQIRIIYPTRRNLERLAQYHTVQELLDHARSHPVNLICPWVESRDGEDHLCIPEGAGYPVTSEPLISALRA